MAPLGSLPAARVAPPSLGNLEPVPHRRRQRQKSTCHTGAGGERSACSVPSFSTLAPPLVVAGDTRTGCKKTLSRPSCLCTSLSFPSSSSSSLSPDKTRICASHTATGQAICRPHCPALQIPSRPRPLCRCRHHHAAPVTTPCVYKPALSIRRDSPPGHPRDDSHLQLNDADNPRLSHSGRRRDLTPDLRQPREPEEPARSLSHLLAHSRLAARHRPHRARLRHSRAAPIHS